MRWFWSVLAAVMLLGLSGCSGLSYGELYCLPQATEDYYDLQDALSEVLEDGYNYLAPASGARQEPVQLTDLDGDGVDEAVAFFRSATDGAVKVYIFSKEEEVYHPAAVLDGAGSAVAAVEYADLDGQGDLELIITYQVSESVTQALQAYRYSGGEATGMLSAGCGRYELADLDSDGAQELLCLTGSGADAGATVEYYGVRDGALLCLGTIQLGVSYDDLQEIAQGQLSDGTPCVVFSGLGAEGQLSMDVCTAADGFGTVVPDEEILQSDPIRANYVYPEDLDGDGVLELPHTRQLSPYDSGSSAQWVIDWYALDAGGGAERVYTTYQSFEEGWYLVLPEAWDSITVKAADESVTVSTVGFYHIIGGEKQELLTIYTLHGSGRSSYAEEKGLTILYSDSATIYAVSLNDSADPWEGTVSMARVSEMFHGSWDENG